MSLPESERLRQLVNDYYHGLITSDSYREQRRQLLDNIGQLDEGAEQTATRPNRKVPPTESFASTPSVTESRKSSSRSMPFAMGGIIAVVVITAAYFALSQFMDANRLAEKDAGEEVSTFGAGPERGVRLLEEFLLRNDWQGESLGNFSLAWEALDEEQREQATGGRQYRRLTMLVHRRIREQLALDTGSGKEQLMALTGFAETIGAPYQQAPMPQSDGLAEVEISDDAQMQTLPTAEDLGEPINADETENSVPAEPRPAETASAVEDVTKQPDDAATQEQTQDPCPSELADTRRPYCRDVLANGENGPALVVLPKGKFRMGSDEFSEESPSHEVEIAYHFAMSRYEITAREYQQFCSATSLPCPEQKWQDDAPVVSVDWDDAISYVEWLSESTGFVYRLPTEAEWEYAARAGTTSPYFFGDEITPSSAHWSDNGSLDAPLGKSEPGVNRNPFRLYHMSGNVREWVHDSWRPDYTDAPGDGSSRSYDSVQQKVIRGGSYKDPGSALRSAARASLERSHRDDVTGFRVVREIRR